MRIYYKQTRYGRLMKGSVRAYIPAVINAALYDSAGAALHDSTGARLYSTEFKITR